jgi:hypothetical protein
MVTLAEFLQARIAEDEEWARAAPPLDAAGVPERLQPGSAARVLADCEAKRRILQLWAQAEAEATAFASPPLGPALGHRAVARFLALPYADHPRYRGDWRP